MTTKEDFIIDAVITWVDGNDPKHRQKVERYIEDKNSLNSKSVRMRYDQVNEIEFTVKSILKYAKFVRNIFIVTDNQIPSFLEDIETAQQKYPNVFIIDHKTIFKGFHHYLPTFNSLSIESLLYKIPNISEHFLYFNDDFFLANKSKSTDFFMQGAPVLRATWKRYHENIWHKKLKSFFKNITNNKKVTYSHSKGFQKAAKLLNFKKYIFFDHNPTPLRKSVIESYFERNPTVLEENIKHRFRHPNQFVCHSLSNHLEIKNDTFTLKKDNQLVYFQSYKKPLLWIELKLATIKKDKNKLFLCMQSLDQCPEKKLKYIKDWLHKKYD
jgi:hypothetical protein